MDTPDGNAMTPIKHWPSGERPREKLLARGADALSDAELLAILLRHGVRGHTALDLARDLINRFGSIGRLVLADERSFCAAPGWGRPALSRCRRWWRWCGGCCRRRCAPPACSTRRSRCATT
jgi:DNA repair protein RadC